MRSTRDFDECVETKDPVRTYIDVIEKSEMNFINVFSEQYVNKGDSRFAP
jgi:hypothetical protein